MVLVKQMGWNPIGFWQHLKKCMNAMPPHSIGEVELSHWKLEAGLVDVR